MTKFGVHAHTLIDGWTTEKGNYAIQAAAEIGFGIIEIPLTKPAEFDTASHRKALQSAGIEATASLALPKELHMPINPKGALQFLTSVLQKLQDIGGEYLCGCIAYASGVFTNAPPSIEERQIVVDTLGRLASIAEKMGMGLGLEVLNRNSTYLYTKLSDARETILAVGKANLTLHADTYHMNFEEEGFYGPLVDCADTLGYMHMVESHRGLIGTGTISWDEVFRGLKDANYSGALVLESFSPFNTKFAASYKLWREPEFTPLVLARKGLDFLKEKSRIYEL